MKLSIAITTLCAVLSMGLAKKRPDPQAKSTNTTELSSRTYSATRLDATETAKQGRVQSATAVSAVGSSQEGLASGDVFGLVTISNNSNVNGETVVIYDDGTLGIKQPTGPGFRFETVLLDDYQLLLTPEPLATVKFDDKNVFFLNTSLYNPVPIFTSQDWTLNTKGGSTVVCPSWNSVLVYVPYGKKAPCYDAVDVDLGIAPIPIN